jgi:hypothetical protein
MWLVEQERIGSIHAVEDMMATAAACYQSALKHDGLPENTTFAVFSDDNPFVPFYEKALNQYREMAAACAAHGYVGLRVSSRDVYKRTRRKEGCMKHIRHAKAVESRPMTKETADRLFELLDQRYPNKVWRVIECECQVGMSCPVAVVKTIDNEDDALMTIANFEERLSI